MGRIKQVAEEICPEGYCTKAFWAPDFAVYFEGENFLNELQLLAQVRADGSIEFGTGGMELAKVSKGKLETLIMGARRRQ